MFTQRLHFGSRNCLAARKLQKICRIALIRNSILVIFARLQKVDDLQVQQLVSSQACRPNRQDPESVPVRPAGAAQ